MPRNSPPAAGAGLVAVTGFSTASISATPNARLGTTAATPILVDVTGTVDGTTFSNFGYTPSSDYATGILAYGGATITAVTDPTFPRFSPHSSSLATGSGSPPAAVVPREDMNALAADRPTVLDVRCDPNVPPIPPHATLEQIKSLAGAVLHGDEDTWGFAKQGLKQKVQQFLPGTKK